MPLHRRPCRELPLVVGDESVDEAVAADAVRPGHAEGHFLGTVDAVLGHVRERDELLTRAEAKLESRRRQLQTVQRPGVHPQCHTIAPWRRRCRLWAAEPSTRRLRRRSAAYSRNGVAPSSRVAAEM